MEQQKESTLQRQSDRECGSTILAEGIRVIHIIGQIEGHTLLPPQTKTTKYEHIIPLLAEQEQDDRVSGILMILNTVGGDVEAGLAIAELVRSMKKPSVSLVLGGGHSIGVPLAVCSDYSFIVPTGTMVIHPVRLNGMVIGVAQTFDYFKQIQDRISHFVTGHCNITEKRFLELMMETKVLTKDVGSILVGKEAVKEGIIDQVGGIKDALKKLHKLIEKKGK